MAPTNLQNTTAARLFDQRANRYGLNLTLYAINDISLTNPLVVIDFVNVSQIALSSDRVYATGTPEHCNLIGFNDALKGELTISTQILTHELLHVISGGMAGQGSDTIIFQNRPGVAPRSFILSAQTVWQDVGGNVLTEQLTFHKVCPKIAYNVTYTGEGDPLSMDVIFDLMADKDGKVLTIEVEGEPKEKLDSATIELVDDTTLQITNNDNRATSIGIYVDGVLATTIPIGG